EALGFAWPLLARVVLELEARRTGLQVALLALRVRGAGQQDEDKDERPQHHRLGFSIVSRLIDLSVASAISSISSRTRCRPAPMAVSSPGSFARWPGAGSNRATMSIRVVRRRLPVKR